jgi:predicted dehydrogenase
MKNSESVSQFLGRRQFVKGSAVLAGGVMLGGLPVEASAYVNPQEKKLKLAVVGCGGRGTGAVVQALKADANLELVAMADAFEDRLEHSLKSIMQSDELPAERKKDIKIEAGNKFVGFDAYKKAIKDADVVILASPPGFRPYHLEEALVNNKHVFCEKPLATDAPGVRKVMELVKMADDKKLNVVVGLQRHYQNSYLEIMKRIHDGEIGDVLSGQVYWNGAGVWVRDRATLLANNPGLTELEYQMRNWYYFNWLCGDHITEQHIHNIDVFNWAKNAYPVRAQGMGGREVRTGKDHGEIFDHHFVEFHYADGSVLNSQCRHIPGCMNKVSETIIGTKGKAEPDWSTGTITDHKGNSLYKHRGANDPNPYQAEHHVLFGAIRNGDHINDLENGAKSTLSSIMGRFATYSGQVITWDEAMNSTVQLMPAEMDWNSQPPILPNEDGYYPVPVPGETKVL